MPENGAATLAKAGERGALQPDAERRELVLCPRGAREVPSENMIGRSRSSWASLGRRLNWQVYGEDQESKEVWVMQVLLLCIPWICKCGLRAWEQCRHAV